jgi:aerobic carbon-monoxide dehydrogenase small subunit
LQCGICTPGILVAAKALLEHNPKPTETEVRFGLAGNLCRCTGYDKIVRAVMDAAQEMRRA